MLVLRTFLMNLKD